MAEKSWYWGGTSVGDAALAAPDGAPYTDDRYSDNWAALFTYDRQLEGVVRSNNVVGNLAVSAPGGNVIRLAPGYALVDGKLYENSANIDQALADGLYTVVIRKVWATQTVRAVLDRAQAASVTWIDGDTWELPLADVTVIGGLITTLKDRRKFLPISGGGMVLLDMQYCYTFATGDLINFSSIPQAPFRALKIIGSAKVTSTGFGLVSESGMLTFNGDANVNHYRCCSFQLDPYIADPYMYIVNYEVGDRAGLLAGSFPDGGEAFTYWGTTEINIFNYSSATKHKNVIADASMNSSAGFYREHIWGNYAHTAAITSISLASSTNFTSGNYNFVQHSWFALYGVL